MKRCCVFAHFDQDDIVDPYVLNYLASLKPFVQKFMFVSTSRLGKEDVSRVEALGATVICRDNSGYDFCSWKTGIECLNLDDYDELLQVNDSCYAPIFDFERIFSRMESCTGDFWGVTKSHTYGAHIQSYFVCYRKPVIQSQAFRDFWRNVTPIEDKDSLVKNYEVGLSKKLLASGFAMNWHFKLSPLDHVKLFPRVMKRKFADVRGNLNPYKYLRNLLVYTNPTFYYYEEMLRLKVPLIKVSLLKGIKFHMPETNLNHVNGIDITTVELIRNHLKRTGFAAEAERWTPPVDAGK